jgi:putative restriction endonuclease
VSATDDRWIRSRAFDWLAEQVSLHGDVLPRELLAAGFVLNGLRVPLVGPQGIFKPKVMMAPFSITTVLKGPYDDSFGDDMLLRYRYRGVDPNHHENRGLRCVMERALPLVYFLGIVPGKYWVKWPVFVVADDPSSLTVTVDLEASESSLLPSVPTDVTAGPDAFRRNYAAAQVRVRLHQRSFRERVLDAYRRQCAFCHLRHDELLDAAHIIPDSEPLGEPTVTNGLALCALHHSAFDRQFIGLRPDCIIEVRSDILEEHDGPTLAHAIQGLHGQRILVPRSVTQRPDPDLLERRYLRFRQAPQPAA